MFPIIRLGEFINTPGLMYAPIFLQQHFRRGSITGPPGAAHLFCNAIHGVRMQAFHHNRSQTNLNWKSIATYFFTLLATV